MSTPMLQQYKSLKKKYSDSILLFRLGDFFEAFEDDAKTISKVLGITLTGRGKGDSRIPMAGIPHHALKQYLPKLIERSYKVAIADQLEPAVSGKLVARDVVKVYTAGTLVDENMLRDYENNYLATVAFDKKSGSWGIAFCDVSTGEFKTKEYPNTKESEIPRALMEELFRIRPAEVLVSRKISEEVREQLSKFTLQLQEQSDFDLLQNQRLLLNSFKIRSFKPFGLENSTSGVIASGVLYQYLLDTQKTDLGHITKIEKLPDKGYLELDENSIRSLELFYSMRGEQKYTLFNCLNECQTPMGQRLLGNWLLRPLQDEKKINKRYDNIDELLSNWTLVEEIATRLSEIVDTQRLLSRLATGSINARDLLFLKKSLIEAVEIFELIKNAELQYLSENLPRDEATKAIKEIISLLSKSIKEDPVLTITEGNIIKKGFDSKLDEINSEAEKGREFIKNLQEQEREVTKIPNLKVGFNNVFGYYIEISKSQVEKVPSNYIRKQTLVNAERYVTDELKHWEKIVLSAQGKASEIEYQIFEKLRKEIIEQIGHLEAVNNSIALIDVYTNFAHLSRKDKLVRPEISSEEGFTTEVKNSRHLVVERSLGADFVPNDIAFVEGEQDLVILTGPNMSGKSTYIRQVALLFLMAQMGCFVPAQYAKLQLVDRIFTRIGSADNLAGGESTFMVEMNEAAKILNNATSRSLIILDEIGRGTSTYDGLSLAWAIVEHIIKEIKAKTLFATHYHELVLLEDKLPGVRNYNVQVKEQEDEVVFMHRIIRGATDRSYGIYVAKISGIPRVVISRANDILNELENTQSQKFSPRTIDYRQQLSFGNLETKDDEVRKQIEEIDIDTLTPLDALLKIKDIQENISRKSKH